jgi:hypothetical protein
MQTVQAADTNEVDKLIFRESDNDRKVRYNALTPCVGALAAPRVHYLTYYLIM